MYMIFLVLDDPDQANAVINSWDQVGIQGATIIESTGIHRHLQHLIPMRYLFHTHNDAEEGNLTIFAIVDDMDTVNKCLEVTEIITGNLDDLHTGVFTAWPLSIVKGLPHKSG
jgi:nitrogen regulatory protein P-II 1